MLTTSAPDGHSASAPEADGPAAPPIRWTVVLAFYNEAQEIRNTLRQLSTQTHPFRLILVDNGSTDGSASLCHQTMIGTGIDYRVLREKTPGQGAALARGLIEVDTEFVATCDADTFYPATYLAEAERLFDKGGAGTVAASAYFMPLDDIGGWRASATAMHQRFAGLLLARQTHVGAAGQCFRTEALRAAGGYCPRRWPFVLGDHEVMHRVMKQGRQVMAWAHWCAPSPRRGTPIRWSLLERIAYHATPFALKDRYFRWLGRRFAARGLHAERLRTRDWEGASA
jgi:glycosyltransferase involved in cell wall biosynthesis